MRKLENFVRSRTDQVMGSNYSYELRGIFDASAKYYT